MGILEDLLRSGGPGGLPTLLDSTGTQWVDDRGNPVVGPGDSTPISDDPRSYNLGPPYTENGAYQGPPPLDPGTALDYSTSDTGMPSNWQDFSTPTNTSTGGGFFSMDDNFAARQQIVPHAFQQGSSLPSTNNWRLLPPQWRKPGYIMRNGQIIDLNAGDLFGPLGGGDTNEHYRSGARLGYPSFSPVGLGANWGSAGWPGSLSGWTVPEPGTVG